jgi:hypothetical protein
VSEESLYSLGFYLERTALFVFSMMARVITVGVLLLVEVEAYLEASALDTGIHMETWIARRGEGAYEAHLTVFLALEGVARSSHEGERIFAEIVEREEHISLRYWK